MAYTSRNINGQTTMANSASVSIASNQSTVPVAFGTATVSNTFATALYVRPGDGTRLDTPANAGSGVSVATTSTVVAASNLNRLEIIIVNDSDTVIYLRLGTSAVLNSGIRLNAGGGSFTTDKYTGQINAISSVAGKNLTVAEV